MTLTELLARHTTRIDEKRWKNPTSTQGEFYADTNQWAIVEKRKTLARGDLIDLFKLLHGPKEMLLLAEELGGRNTLSTRLTRQEFADAEAGETRCKIITEAANFYLSKLRDSHEGKSQFFARGITEENMEQLTCGWAPGADALVTHLKSKGIEIQAITRLGLASVLRNQSQVDKFTSRIILPVVSEFGNIIGLNARRTGDENQAKSAGDFSSAQKYLLSANCDKSDHPEFLAQALEDAKKSGEIVFCEGKFDAITARKARLNAVALNGASATENLIRRIANLGISPKICLDSDKAGRTQTVKILRSFWKHGVKPTVAEFPADVKDIDTFIHKNRGKPSEIRWVPGIERAIGDMAALNIEWKDLSKDFADHGDMLRAVRILTKGMPKESIELAHQSATLETMKNSGVSVAPTHFVTWQQTGKNNAERLNR